MKAYLTIIFFLLPLALHAQIITTIAGGGSVTTYIGPATAAEIHSPTAMTFDNNGNLYFAEPLDNLICKIDALGNISIIAGTGIAGYNGDSILAIAAQLNDPSAAICDTQGNIYIADASNHRIRKVDLLTGFITTIAGTGIGGYNGDEILAKTAEINEPTDICFDKKNNLYIADFGNYRVRKIDTSGVITTYAGTGDTGTSGDGGAATTAKFMYLKGLTSDDTGNIYIADWTGGTIRKINNAGIINTIAGVTETTTYSGDGMIATSANFAPIKIRINKSGVLFIADFPNNRVRAVDNFGIIHTVAGNGICCYSGDNGNADTSELGQPGGVELDSCGNLYISQVNNPRIRKVALNPACWPESVETPAKPTSITLYPNPTSSTVIITAPVPINNVTITNTLGQQVYTHTFTASKAQIDISHLPQGIYIVRVNDAFVQKLVKE